MVSCSGRLVEGAESAALERTIDEVLPFTPYVVLHLGAVEFVDSAGLGLLVRLLHRTRRAGGNLTLCAVPRRIVEALRVTHLSGLFELCATESDAVAACYHHATEQGAAFGAPDILCVHPSADVLAYLRELLGQAGYVLLSATNVSDALTLFRAAQPRGVVIANELRGTDTSAAQTFNQLADRLPLVVLPDDFATHEAGEAGQSLLARVAAAVPPGTARNSPL